MASIRIGLPLVGGTLPAAARALGAPVLVSANALARYRNIRWENARRRTVLGRRGQPRDFAGFRLQAPDLDGLDVALDSAGFVAHAHYGLFPWTVDDYVELAASRPWTWWSQMDACCEAEIAPDRGAVRLRQAETINLLFECERAARRRRIPLPVPVLQGRTPADYVWHADQLHLADRPLVGVGSMCRREVHGPEGLIAVVDALDRVLPAACRLHLFGVKSEGLAVLAEHPRVASIDSMAWDTGARYANKHASRTMAVRVAAMRRWYEAQLAAVARRPGMQGGLFGAGEPEGVPDAYAEWGDLVADGEIDAGAAAYFAAWDDCWGYDRGLDDEPQEPATEAA